MILDYTTFLHEYNIQNGYQLLTSVNANLLNIKRGWCPFCDRKAPCVHEVIINGSYNHSENIVWACPACGWWEQKTYYDDMRRLREKLRYAILRKYDAAAKDIPITTLCTYLKQKPTLLYDVHPTKMEEIVQSVFADFFQCEIHHCGKSHDGGIDLYYVEADIPTAIQVKRRESDKYAEPVNSIRDLLGATLLSEFKGAAFVTTADHFSREAKKAADLAVDLKHVQKFELYDFNRFTSLLNLTYKGKDHPWKSFITETG